MGRCLIDQFIFMREVVKKLCCADVHSSANRGCLQIIILGGFLHDFCVVYLFFYSTSLPTEVEAPVVVVLPEKVLPFTVEPLVNCAPVVPAVHLTHDLLILLSIVGLSAIFLILFIYFDAENARSGIAFTAEVQ